MKSVILTFDNDEQAEQAQEQILASKENKPSVLRNEMLAEVIQSVRGVQIKETE